MVEMIFLHFLVFHYAALGKSGEILLIIIMFKHEYRISLIDVVVLIVKKKEKKKLTQNFKNNKIF